MNPKSPYPPSRSRDGALASGLPAIMALLLVFSAAFRAAPAPDLLAQEQHRLQRFVDTLHAEGAVQNMAPCRDFEVCVRVTGLFRDLEHGDKRGIARLIRDYFALHPDGTRFVTRVRFIDGQTGIELGAYADGHLDWEGRF